MRTLYKFHGGIHPPTHKSQSTAVPIRQLALPDKLVIPFHQHAGNRAKPVVQVGDYVLKGQLIGLPQDGLSSAIHASTSGTICAIGMELVAHPSGLADLCATLIPDGKDEWITRTPMDYQHSNAADLRTALRMAGVVGLGGAAFPSDIKLNLKHKVTTLILNGAECEPYITCDDMLMRERASEIVGGAEIMRQILNAEGVLIGIEDNKPEAIRAMQLIAENAHNVEVVAIPTLYPSGSAKQLIKVLTNLEVPSGKLPTDIGVQCFNVATAASAFRAIEYGEPLISRIVTLTGEVGHAQNVEVLIGTPVSALLNHAAVLPHSQQTIMGGPMMGIRLPSKDVSVVKATNCIIAASDKLFPPAPPVMPCIRCTRCVEVCPADLQPQDLYWFAKAKNFEKADEYSLFDCIECGACSYVCPSNIPLVQFYRFAKSELRATIRDKQNSEIARERHDFHELRIEREKQEKADKLAAREKAAAAAKVAATAVPSAPTDSELTPEQIAKLAEMEARRLSALATSDTLKE
ncbi:MAG: electron transport complex subunit RsxC [Gallionella sp.]